jgi:hypothetical protein
MDQQHIFMLVWAVANIVTGLTYFHIPYEIRQWTKGTRFAGLAIFVPFLFIWFITGCGIHHLNMVNEHSDHHVITLRTLIVDCNMMFASLTTSWVLYHFRSKVRPILLKADTLFDD